MKPTKGELDSFRDAPVPDLAGPGMRLLFVGINPSLWTAATGTHFAHPNNRFYRALHVAGIIPRVPDHATALAEADRVMLLDAGIGITNLVNRATRTADELRPDELLAGPARVAGVVRRWRPAVVAIAGVSDYRTAFGRPRAKRGLQPDPIEGAELWVVPNPSPLNRNDTVATLAAAYAEPARAAGILP